MERLQRLAEFWDWLPAFRAVAETPHLPTASESLNVSASALSRMVKLLEANLGTDLFRREGRRLVLNEAGELFLTRLRAAMRLVDEGLHSVTSEEPSGSFHVSTVGVLNEILLPALGRLSEGYPLLIFHQHHHPSQDVNSFLTRGQLDVALLPDPIPHERLDVTTIGTSTNGIYCGQNHPLFRRRKLSRAEVLKHRFAAPVPSASAAALENWPATIKRQIGIHLTQQNMALEMAATGRFLIVLPDIVLDVSRPRPRLRRLPIELVPPTTFYAVRRQALVPGDLSQALVDDVAGEFNRAQRGGRRRRR